MASSNGPPQPGSGGRPFVSARGLLRHLSRLAVAEKKKKKCFPHSTSVQTSMTQRGGGEHVSVIIKNNMSGSSERGHPFILESHSANARRDDSSSVGANLKVLVGYF